MKFRYVYTLLFLLVIVFWIGRGWYQSKLSIQNEKNLSIQGCVAKMYRKEGTKTYDVTLTNGFQFRLSSFELNDLIDIGDSVLKKPGSLKYNIYKLDNMQKVMDSIIYLASDQIKMNPFKRSK